MVATSPSVTAEAERLVRAAHEAGLHVKAMGGVAIWLVSPSVRLPPYARAYRDLDLVASGKEARALRSFLESQGYLPDRMFNAIHGAQRLIFTTTHGDWSIDVLFDELRMSHRVDLRDRLAGTALTLAPADLLLTKLQIWRVNEKDLGDALCLLADHPVVDGSRDRACGRRDRHRRRADRGGAGCRLGLLPYGRAQPRPDRRARARPTAGRGRARGRPGRRRSSRRSRRHPRPSAGGPGPGSANASSGTRSPRRLGARWSCPGGRGLIASRRPTP